MMETEKMIAEEQAAPVETPEQAEEARTRKGRKNKPRKPLWRELLEWAATLALAVIIALPLRTYVFEPVRVDGRSMNPTLVHGEVMFVTKFDYLIGTPERFDVVICHYPDRGNTNFVKRVVGLPGDTVEVKDGYLYVNGEKYEEEYIVHRPDYERGPYVVPEGQYYVLGDNRSNSNDSHIIGPLDEDMIVGKVRQVVLPIGSWRGIE